MQHTKTSIHRKTRTYLKLCECTYRILSEKSKNFNKIVKKLGIICHSIIHCAKIIIKKRRPNNFHLQEAYTKQLYSFKSFFKKRINDEKEKIKNAQQFSKDEEAYVISDIELKSTHGLPSTQKCLL